MRSQRTSSSTPRRRRRLPVFAVLLAAMLVASMLGVPGSGATSKAPRTVHLRGTAYEFNNVTTLLAGATIRVAEFPQLKAVVRHNGTYDLVVPDHARVTPYIVATGYHTIYLQTFTTDGQDLANVNFQTPADGVYSGLVLLLHVPVDARGNPRACAIVSTFSTRNVRDLSFQAFIAYGAHGVAGATATAAPALPAPVYFNTAVIPDPAQKASSQDGGVVWTGVPSGVYTITAHHPSSRFASFVASCRPGRIINANPPWGLHQLGLPNPARISASWSRQHGGLVLGKLTARGLPTASVVRVRCAGRRCPFSTRILRPTGVTVDIRAALGTGPVRLRPGQQIEVTITAHAYDGAVVRWTIASSGLPRPARLCVPLGNTQPQRHC